jgi:cytochrome c-type biogenesis protein CcmH/NrfG
MAATARGFKAPRPRLLPRAGGLVYCAGMCRSFIPTPRSAPPRDPSPRRRRLTCTFAALLLAVVLGGCARFGGQAPAPVSPSPVADPARALADADAAYAAGDWPRAAEGYLAAARAAGSDPAPWFKLGNVYFRSGRHDLAASAYEETLRLAPDHAKAWHNLGVVRLHQADASLSRALDRASADDPALAESARALRATLEPAIAPAGAPAP